MPPLISDPPKREAKFVHEELFRASLFKFKRSRVESERKTRRKDSRFLQLGIPVLLLICKSIHSSINSASYFMDFMFPNDALLRIVRLSRFVPVKKMGYCSVVY